MKEKINYIIFGILTVIVNLSIFYGLLYFFNDNNNIILMFINIIAFIVAIIFAYCTNTIYVFKQKCNIRNCLYFMYARAITLIIENIGLLVASFMELNIMISKYILTIVVIILNYILSKYWVYKEL